MALYGVHAREQDFLCVLGRQYFAIFAVKSFCFRLTQLMPSAQIREVAAAQRLDNVRYAIRDLASVADEVTKQGHKVLSLNVGDPNIFDFQTPPHLIEAVYKAMRDNRNGYAPSPGIPEALESIRGEAARKGITTVQDVFVTSGASEAVDICLTALVNPGENILTPSPDYPLYSAVLCKLGIPVVTYDLNEDDGWQPDLIDVAAQNNFAYPRHRADQSQQSHRRALFPPHAGTAGRSGAAQQSGDLRRRNLRQADIG